MASVPQLSWVKIQLKAECSPCDEGNHRSELEAKTRCGCPMDSSAKFAGCCGISWLQTGFVQNEMFCFTKELENAEPTWSHQAAAIAQKSVENTQPQSWLAGGGTWLQKPYEFHTCVKVSGDSWAVLASKRKSGKQLNAILPGSIPNRSFRVNAITDRFSKATLNPYVNVNTLLTWVLNAKKYQNSIDYWPHWNWPMQSNEGTS